MPVLGQIIGGSFEDLIVRQKPGAAIELGELVSVQAADSRLILQCFDIYYGSQLSSSHHELMSGMLMTNKDVEVFEPELNNYNLVKMRPLIDIRDRKVYMPKSMPLFFSNVYAIEQQDLDFFRTATLPLGYVRSGSKNTGVMAKTDGKKLFTHHMLVSSSTGKGKSNFCKNLIQLAVDGNHASFLIFDPHDEYRELGITRYSALPLPGDFDLIINIENLKPEHLIRTMNLSDAQKDSLYYFYNHYGKSWIEKIILCKESAEGIRLETIDVVKRRMNVILGIYEKNGELKTRSIFSCSSGYTTISDICNSLENGKGVVVETSLLSSDVEIILATIICRNLFDRYTNYKKLGISKPVISIVIEEAPRVLNTEALLSGNIFSKIAREGRKFGLGLIAVTQLASPIPKEIMANLNTKVILGTELASERNYLIECASNDLSKDSRAIASLNVGEAIITSPFLPFAVPIKIEEFKKQEKGYRKVETVGEF